MTVQDPQAMATNVTETAAVRQEKARAAARSRRMSVLPSAQTLRNASRSRIVGAMKVIFPLVAVLLIALVVAWPYMSANERGFRLGFALLETRDSGDPSMVNARFHGADSNDHPYTVTADFARNLSRDTERVDLEMPKADMALDDGTWLVLTAKTGHFHRVDQALDLVGSVNLFHDTGYEFNTSVARVDLEQGMASGDQRVSGHGPFGTLEAEGFRILNSEKVIRFTGKAHAVLYPGPDYGEK